jgi:hypothetical protein
MAKKVSNPVPKKGVSVKPTSDSTAYYNRLSETNFSKAAKVRNAPYGGKLASEERKERTAKEKEYISKAIKAQDDALRQSRKGKPGYDKNGFAIKKSTIKTKK